MATLHYASGGSAAEVATAGFNLVDVQYLSQVNELPDGTKALVYLGEHDGVTQSFIDKVTPFLNNEKVFGFFLTDEPDPTGRWGTYATAEELKAESDWIHSHFPGAKTFVTMMNMGSNAEPSFANTYNPENTGIDYYGVGAYPVNSETVDNPDYNQIDRMVAAAVDSGIPVDKIIPIFQAFGGGNWISENGASFVVPTVDQQKIMMDHWAELVPAPAFDYTYKWGTQNGDTALESSPELQAFFLEHNTSSTSSTLPETTEPTPPTAEPTSPTSEATPPPTSEPTSPSTSEPTSPSEPSHPVKPAAGGHTFHWAKGADLFHATTDNDTYYSHDKLFASVSQALSAHGGGGSDSFIGHGGKHAFAFNTALGARNVDRITDSHGSQDKILDHTMFAGLQKGAHAGGNFYLGQGAHHASDHINYNSSTGALSFDSDGSGGHGHAQFATVAPHHSHGADSFFVI